MPHGTGWVQASHAGSGRHRRSARAGRSRQLDELLKILNKGSRNGGATDESCEYLAVTLSGVPMRLRTAAITSLVAVAAAGSFAPALAAPKPVTKTYTATAGTADPTPALGTATGAEVCEPMNAAAKFSEPFKVPYAGTLKVDMTGFVGDWDMAVFQGDKQLAFSAQDVSDPVDRPEAVTLKLKKAGTTIEIRSCNFAGGPTAKMAYVFTAS